MKKLLVLAVLALVAGLMVVGARQAIADDCDATVTAPASIQAAADAASPGDVICLSGTFSDQQVTISTSRITLRSASTAVMDGTGLADPLGPSTNSAIKIANGVSRVTIEGLEIRNYEGNGGANDRSSAIETWNVSTSRITVRDNYLHDNFWNGVLVGSNGSTTHTRWTVEDNTVAANGFINIELTNCDRCRIEGNSVSGSSSFVGIVVQARNDGQGGTVTQKNVKVEENKVSGTTWGILAQAYGVSSGDDAVLEKVTVEENEVDASGAHGIYVRGRAGASGTSTVHDVRVNENEVSGSGENGIYLHEVNPGTVVTGNTVSDNEVVGSGTYDCHDTTSDSGTAGTANTWTENEGDTSSPAGLCGDEDDDDDDEDDD